MKLVEFRVTNFRSITDSGWIKTDGLTTLVGKNQAGKTSLLRALHKFNPFTPEPYNIDREWPRGRRKERNPKSTVVTARFQLTSAELQQVAAALGNPSNVPQVIEVERKYDGSRLVRFQDNFDPTKSALATVTTAINALHVFVTEKASAEAREDFGPIITSLRALVAKSDLAAISKEISTTLIRMTGDAQPVIRTADAAERSALTAPINAVGNAVPKMASASKAMELVGQWIPTFVYMDDYRTYSGSTFLNQLKERVDANQPSPEDLTILTLMRMAGLDLNQQVTAAGAENREQRILDLNDASITLTKEMSGRWSQEEYTVHFQADQFHFMTFVQKPGQTALVPLEEESRGFQWFFSFDMHFAHETKGTLKGAVLLLDEPGLHLHPKAQQDLLSRLEAYARDNQVIFSTHLPFMIDLSKPERLKIVNTTSDGTQVGDDLFANADPDARFTLQAALGMSASQSLLVAPWNLVVEGPDDYWFISAISDLMRRSGKGGLDERIKVTPAFGASEAAYLATFMYGQDLDVGVLFDSDNAGEAAAESLVKKWMTKYKGRELLITKVADLRTGLNVSTIEDLFPVEYYLAAVNDAYKKELDGTPLNIDGYKQPRVIDRVEAAFSARGLKGFNKGRASKVIYRQLRESKLEAVPAETTAAFGKLFQIMNAALEKWQGSSDSLTKDRLWESKPSEARTAASAH